MSDGHDLVPVAAATAPASPPSALARHGVPHALQALRAIVMRELFKFSQQTGRLVSALVRPLLWLAVFAAGFRNVFGVAIVEPYDTYIPYDVYIAPGLVGMVLLFNGMQSSLAMVYDREMGLMRLLLTAPLPRAWLLFCKLCATALLSVLQALAFVAVAMLIGTDLPVFSLAGLHALRRADCRRADAGCAGAAAVGAHQAARELRRHDELRHFPDVLHVDRALPAVEAAGVGRRVGLPARAVQPVHARGRVDPLRPVRQGSRAWRRGWCLGCLAVFFARRLLGLRPAARLRRAGQAGGGA